MGMGFRVRARATSGMLVALIGHIRSYAHASPYAQCVEYQLQALQA